MALFHVFIEGVAQAPGVDAAQVAAAIGARFGLDAADIARRLAGGRFRVKANVDYPTACSFKIELERLGVRCGINDAETGAAITAPPMPASMAPKPSASSAPAPLVPPPAPRAPPPAPPLAATPTGQYQSGLAAAYGAGDKGVGEAALGALATGAFRLTALDKNSGEENPNDEDDNTSATMIDAAPPLPLSAADGEAGLTLLGPPPPSIGPTSSARPSAVHAVPNAVPNAAPHAAPPAPTRPPPASRRPDNAAFAPPPEDTGEGEHALTLLVDVRSAKQQASAEAAAATARAEQAAAQTASAGGTTPPGPAAEAAPKRTPQAYLALALAPNPRWAIGLLLAVVLGYGAAHGYAAGKETAVRRAVDARIAERQAAVVTPTEWDELDGYRAKELAAKTTAIKHIAQNASIIWLLLSAGFGAAWQLAIPWSRILANLTPRSEGKT